MTRVRVKDPQSGHEVFRETRLTGEDWLDMADEMLAGLPREIAKEQEYYDLAGLGCEEAEAPYDTVLRRIKEVGRLLDETRVKLVALRRHTHAWQDNDYCSICGADGRA